MLDNESYRIVSVHLKQFRCFSERTFHLDAPLVYIYGANGSGKTSLIEALHYACYMRSFRTPTFRELSSHEVDSFFIKLSVRGPNGIDHIQVGCHGSKRLIKINQKRVDVHRDLIQHYRAITITEDSLALVQEGPSERRSFLDVALSMHNEEYSEALRLMQATLEVRNAALYKGDCPPDLYTIWTQQLWDRTINIQLLRIEFLRALEQEVKRLISTYFDNQCDLQFVYMPKNMYIGDTYDAFIQARSTLKAEEYRFKRSLFGAHLDDFSIVFRQTNARSFASRGQQKLIVFLIKVAYSRLFAHSGGPIVMLIDDFMVDFDHKRMATLMTVLYDLHIQLIFTSPVKDLFFEELAKKTFPSTLSLNLD